MYLKVLIFLIFIQIQNNVFQLITFCADSVVNIFHLSLSSSDKGKFFFECS